MKALLAAALLDFYASVHSGGVCATLGAPRTGKTTAVEAADHAGVFARRVVFDPYARRDRMEMLRGRKVRAWSGMLISPPQLYRNPWVLDAPRLRLVVCPEGTPTEADLGRDFGRLCAMVWHQGDVDILAEEIGRYGRSAVEWVNQIASGAGHAGIRLFAICQSFGRIAKDARRNVSHIVAFAQGEESDFAALRARCGGHFEDRARQLAPGDRQAITWRLGERATSAESAGRHSASTNSNPEAP